MGSDSNAVPSASTSTPSTPNGKRSRDLEDEVYLDNLHSQKRYLSEVCPFLFFSVTLILSPMNFLFFISFADNWPPFSSGSGFY